MTAVLEPPTVAARPAPGDAAAEGWAVIERAQAGDRDAFGELYERYEDPVFRFIYYRCGSRPLAEDLTADTFVRALKRIDTFRWQGRDLGAWLITIARNLVADHFKSGRCRLEVPTGEVIDGSMGTHVVSSTTHHVEGPETEVVDHLVNVELLGVLQELNEEQREVLVLRFLRGLNVAETAQVMGKNEGAIKALQYRAVRAMRRALPAGFEEANR